MVKLGLWAQLATMASFGGVFRISPPVTMPEEQSEESLTIMEHASSETLGSLPMFSAIVE